MKIKQALPYLIAGTFWGVMALAQAPQSGAQAPQSEEPALNVSPYRHGNIAHAQQLSRDAYDAMTRAQEANEFDLGGHAARAKQLLAIANDEMKLAAQWANHGP
jgi:hypothetical protein